MIPDIHKLYTDLDNNTRLFLDIFDTIPADKLQQKSEQTNWSIMDCAEKLKNHEEIRFIFIGRGVKRNWVESQIEKNDLTNVFLLNPLPREKRIDFLNACDVGFVSLVRKMYGVAMPSRTYNFLAAGKPILALTENKSEVDRIITEENVGWTIPPQDSQMLLKT